MAAVTEAASHTPLAETDETQGPSHSCRCSRKRAHRNTAAFMHADVRSSVKNGLMENAVQSWRFPASHVAQSPRFFAKLSTIGQESVAIWHMLSSSIELRDETFGRRPTSFGRLTHLGET